MLKENFDWGKASQDFINGITWEMAQGCYERVFQVKEGDVVVDIGASVGPFLNTIIDRKPAKCYAIEPVSLNNEAILNNTGGNVVIINRAITDDEQMEVGDWEGTVEIVKGLKFSDFVKSWNIDRIDFLKTDCEGGEYEIFKPSNLRWIIDHCKYCVGEWHLASPENTVRFRNFRDNVLPLFKQFRVFAVDGVDITWSLYSEQFIHYYTEVIIHIEV